MPPFCTTDVCIAQAGGKKKIQMLREECLIVKTNPLFLGEGVSQRSLVGAFPIFWRVTFASALGDGGAAMVKRFLQDENVPSSTLKSL